MIERHDSPRQQGEATAITIRNKVPMQSHGDEIWALVRRIRSEFDEMPELRLTRVQAQQLFGLEAHRCESILAALLDAGFLTLTRAGTYVRSDSAV